MSRNPIIIIAILAGMPAASCGEASVTPSAPVAVAPEPAPQTEASVTPPSMPKGPGFVRVEGQTAVLSDGLLTLQIPEDWKEVTGAQQQLEIEATRHLSNPDRWARCSVRLMALPNMSGESQESVNVRFANQVSPTIKRLKAEGALIDYSISDQVGDVLLIRMTFEENGVHQEVRQLPIIHHGFVVAVHLDCDAALPLLPEDKRDMDAFLGSAKLNRPT